MGFHALKFPIGRKQQSVVNAQLRQERVDRANLNAVAAAPIT